eukprot:4179006-Prymnesium_polylepis.2
MSDVWLCGYGCTAATHASRNGHRSQGDWGRSRLRRSRAPHGGVVSSKQVRAETFHPRRIARLLPAGEPRT